MTTEVNFEPGCVFGQNFVACGPGGVTIRERGKCHGLCGKDDARLICREPNSPWHGPDWVCECGDRWCLEGMHPRPAVRGWRKRAQAEFEKRWEAALPEGTKIMRDWTDDGGGYLVGVRLPDGTEVRR